MAYLKLGYKLFVKNINMSFISVIQIAITLLLINICISNIYSYIEPLNIFKNLNYKKAIYFQQPLLSSIDPNLTMGDEAFEILEKKIEKSNQIIENLKNVKSVNKDYIIYGKDISCYGYDKFTSSNIKKQLKSGKWFDEEPKKQNVLNVVVCDNGKYKTGDIIYIDSPNDPNKKIECKITGILKKDIYSLYNSSTASDTVDVSHLLRKQENIGLFSIEDLKEMNYNISSHSNSFIVFNENISNQDYDQAFEMLKQVGDPIKIEKINSNTKKAILDILKKQFPIIIAMFLIMVISIITFIFLNISKNKKIFGIYYLCGFNFKSCFIIYFINIIINIILSLVLFIGLYVLFFMINDNYITGVFSINNITGTLIVLIFIFISSFVINTILLKNKSSKDIIKKIYRR